MFIHNDHLPQPWTTWPWCYNLNVFDRHRSGVGFVKLIHTVVLEQGTQLHLLLGDLTRVEADVIVNAANDRLLHGRGVAGAITRRGGDDIQTESSTWVKEYGPVTPDNPALTTAGDLQSKAIIHVVGPRWGEGDEDRKLRLAVTAALTMADEHEFQSIAFPAISTGIFGFPMDRAAEIMLQAIELFSDGQPNTSLQRIDLVLFDRPAVDAFSIAMHDRWPEMFQLQ